jgi:hypothetical protein
MCGGEVETDESRGWSGPPRQEPANATKRLISTGMLKAHFRQATQAITGREPELAVQSRRRAKGEDTTSGFLLCGTGLLRRAFTRRERLYLPTSWQPSDDVALNQPPKREDVSVAISEGPMTIGELILWYLATGRSTEELRATFPELLDAPPPEPRWNPLDWLDMWQDQNHENFFAHEHDASGASLYPHL